MFALHLYRPSLRAAGAIAVLFAWVGSLGWLGARQWRRSEEATLSDAASLRLAPGTVWFALDAGGVPVGNAGITLDTLSPGYRVSESVVLEIPAGSALVRTTRRSDIWLGATLNLERMHSRYSREGRQADWTISVFGDTLTAHFAAGALATQGRAAFPELPTARAVIPYRFALGGTLESGRERTVTMVEGWPMAGATAHVYVGRDSMIRFVDSTAPSRDGAHLDVARYDSARSYAVVVTGPAGPRRLWVDRRGSVSLIETPLGVRWLRTDFDLGETEFRKTLSSRAAQIRAAIPPMVALALHPALHDTSTRERRFVVTHRDGTPVDTELLQYLSGGRQSVSGDTITVRAASADAESADAESIADPMIQSEAAMIVGLQRSLLSKSLEPGSAAYLATLRHMIRIDTSAAASDDALSTLAAFSGRPDGLARLYVALIRSVHTPARYVVGVYPAGDTLLTHAWAEVWSPAQRRWIAVDPVAGRPVANTRLIRLAMGGSSHPDELVMQLANARIVELEPAAP